MTWAECWILWYEQIKQIIIINIMLSLNKSCLMIRWFQGNFIIFKHIALIIQTSNWIFNLHISKTAIQTSEISSSSGNHFLKFIYIILLESTTTTTTHLTRDSHFYLRQIWLTRLTITFPMLLIFFYICASLSGSDERGIWI